MLGPEVNGATRWIDIGVGQLQPSEFLKPFFVVAMAWLLSLRESDRSLPVFPLSAALTGAVAFLYWQNLVPLYVLWSAVAIGLYPLVKTGLIDLFTERKIGTEIFVTTESGD